MKMISLSIQLPHNIFPNSRLAPSSSEDYNPPSSPSLASSSDGDEDDADKTADSATAAQELIASFTAEGYVLNPLKFKFPAKK